MTAYVCHILNVPFLVWYFVFYLPAKQKSSVHRSLLCLLIENWIYSLHFSYINNRSSMTGSLNWDLSSILSEVLYLKFTQLSLKAEMIFVIFFPHPYFTCVDGWYKNSALNIFNLLKSTLIDGSFIQWPAGIPVIVSFQPMKTSVLCKVGGPERFPSWITLFVKCDSASTDGFLRGQLVPGTVTGWRHRWAVRVNNGSLLCFKTSDKDSTWPTSGKFLHNWIFTIFIVRLETPLTRSG